MANKNTSRQSNGDGSISQRKDGRWEYKVSIGADMYGKPVRKSFYGNTKSEAKQKGRDYNDKTIPKVDEVKSIGEWALVWLEVYKKDKVEFGTYRNYKLYVEGHILPSLGNLKFEEIKPFHIENFFNEEKNLSASARKHIKIALNGIFETAIDNKFCTSNPIRKIKIIKEVENKPMTLKKDDITIILKNAPDLPHGHLIEILLYTGMRMGEACALKWIDVDFEENVIYIRESVAKSEEGLKVKTTKTGKERVIGINDNLNELLKRISNKSNYILGDAENKYLSLSQFEKRYQAFFKALNNTLPEEEKINYMSPHKCRHTYATYLLKGGANLREVQKLLGHSKIGTTEIYTEIDIEDIKNSVKKLKY